MLIGREKEIQELRQAYDSEESKFVAIFGRRRIGKTYLVREVFMINLRFPTPEWQKPQRRNSYSDSICP